MFSDCTYDTGAINWDECKTLYRALQKVCRTPTSPYYDKTHEYLNSALKHANHPKLKPSLQDRAEGAIGSEEEDYQDWLLGPVT